MIAPFCAPDLASLHKKGGGIARPPLPGSGLPIDLRNNATQNPTPFIQAQSAPDPRAGLRTVAGLSKIGSESPLPREVGMTGGFSIISLVTLCGFGTPNWWRNDSPQVPSPFSAV